MGNQSRRATCQNDAAGHNGAEYRHPWERQVEFIDVAINATDARHFEHAPSERVQAGAWRPAELRDRGYRRWQTRTATADGDNDHGVACTERANRVTASFAIGLLLVGMIGAVVKRIVRSADTTGVAGVE